MEKTDMKNVFKFVEWEVSPLETHKDTRVYQLREKLNNGEKLTEDELYEITDLVNRQGYHSTGFRQLGYLYGFSDVLYQYIIETENWNSYDKVYATSPKAYRKYHEDNEYGELFGIYQLVNAEDEENVELLKNVNHEL